MTSENRFLNTGIVSIDPLVTYTKRHKPTPIGIAGSCPELFEGRSSLHFVGPVWNYEDHDVADIAVHWRETAKALPDATFVFLNSTDRETLALSAAGVPAITCSELLFVDDTVFKPYAPADFSGAAFDAIYVARLEPYKRHQLAREIENLALMFDARFDQTQSAYDLEVTRLLPNARYLNFEKSAGQYVSLDPDARAQRMNQARCGLCLSKEEGAMRVSMEYLMCGLPVVTTRSKGGRDRYFADLYVIVAEDDPANVARAVREIGRRKLSKLAIRDHIMRVVSFERRNFLSFANALVQKQFGVANLFSSLRPFIESWPFVEPEAAWSRARLKPFTEWLRPNA